MVLLDIITIVIGIVLLGGLLTQVIVPGVRGTQLFPFFRKEKALVQQLEEERQLLREAYMNRDLREIHKRVDEVNKPEEKENGAA